MIADVVYILCALASAACAFLLFRGWRASRARLLLWGGVCFTGLMFHNVLLVIDTRIDTVDLAAIRLLPALLGAGFLMFGLIRDDR